MSGCLSGLFFDNVGTFQSSQVKRTPIDSINELIINLKHESVSHCCNQYKIQICIPACIKSSQFVVRTSMYSVRLKDFCMDKIALKTFISQNMKKTEQLVIS